MSVQRLCRLAPLCRRAGAFQLRWGARDPREQSSRRYHRAADGDLPRVGPSRRAAGTASPPASYVDPVSPLHIASRPVGRAPTARIYHRALAADGRDLATLDLCRGAAAGRAAACHRAELVVRPAVARQQSYTLRSAARSALSRPATSTRGARADPPRSRARAPDRAHAPARAARARARAGAASSAGARRSTRERGSRALIDSARARPSGAAPCAGSRAGGADAAVRARELNDASRRRRIILSASRRAGAVQRAPQSAVSLRPPRQLRRVRESTPSPARPLRSGAILTSRVRRVLYDFQWWRIVLVDDAPFVGRPQVRRLPTTIARITPSRAAGPIDRARDDPLTSTGATRRQRAVISLPAGADSDVLAAERDALDALIDHSTSIQSRDAHATSAGTQSATRRLCGADPVAQRSPPATSTSLRVQLAEQQSRCSIPDLAPATSPICRSRRDRHAPASSSTTTAPTAHNSVEPTRSSCILTTAPPNGVDPRYQAGQSQEQLPPTDDFTQRQRVTPS